MRDGCTLDEVGDLARAMSLKEAVVYDPADAYRPFGGAQGRDRLRPLRPGRRGRAAPLRRGDAPVHRAPLGDRRGLRPAAGHDRRGVRGGRPALLDRGRAAAARRPGRRAGPAARGVRGRRRRDRARRGRRRLRRGRGGAGRAAARGPATPARPAPWSRASGRWAARPRATSRAPGVRVVGIADREGLVADPDGLDVERLLRARDAHGAIDRAALAGEQQRPGADWLALDAELLVPAALSYVIGRAEAERIGARVIVEAANVPTQPGRPSGVLAARGVLVVPDFVANVATNAWWWWTLFGDIAPEREAAFAKIAATMRRLVGALLDRVGGGRGAAARRGDRDRRREPRPPERGRRRGLLAVLRPLAAVAVLLGATAPAAVAAPREVTVGVSGDLLPHLPVVARARRATGAARPDFRPMLRRIRPLGAAQRPRALPRRDAARAGPPSGYPRFSSPPALAARDPRHGLRRVQHRLEPLRRPRAGRDRRHAARARPRAACATPAPFSTARQRRNAPAARATASGSRSSPTPSTRTASRCRTPGRSTSPAPGGSCATPAARAAPARGR